MAHPTFQIGDYVIAMATHDNRWYRAKVCGTRQPTDSGLVYKIHYHGWSATWDEDLSPNRIAKGSKDKKICEQLIEAKTREMQTLENQNENENEETNDEKQEQQDTEIRILPLSGVIKQSLCQQYELIQEAGILYIALPKPQDETINAIIDRFLRDHSGRIEPENQLVLKQITDSIRYYFNQCVTFNLLFFCDMEVKQKNDLVRGYKQEKHKTPNEEHTKSEEFDFASLYGVEHLFRLLRFLPQIYGCLTFEHAEQAVAISQYVSLFQAYLTKHFAQTVTN